MRGGREGSVVGGKVVDVLTWPAGQGYAGTYVKSVWLFERDACADPRDLLSWFPTRTGGDGTHPPFLRRSAADHEASSCPLPPTRGPCPVPPSTEGSGSQPTGTDPFSYPRGVEERLPCDSSSAGGTSSRLRWWSVPDSLFSSPETDRGKMGGEPWLRGDSRRTKGVSLYSSEEVRPTGRPPPHPRPRLGSGSGADRRLVLNPPRSHLFLGREEVVSTSVMGGARRVWRSANPLSSPPLFCLWRREDPPPPSLLFVLFVRSCVIQLTLIHETSSFSSPHPFFLTSDPRTHEDGRRSQRAPRGTDVSRGGLSDVLTSSPHVRRQGLVSRSQSLLDRSFLWNSFLNFLVPFDTHSPFYQGSSQCRSSPGSPPSTVSGESSPSFFGRVAPVPPYSLPLWETFTLGLSRTPKESHYSPRGSRRLCTFPV